MKPMAPKKPAKKDAEVERPDVEIHDEIYYRHKDGPRSGKVVSVGEHGCQVDCSAGGGRHKVRWADLHGHKVRVRPDVKVVDQGIDGMLVEDPRGRRRYVHDPVGEETPPLGEMTKSEVEVLPGPRLVLFGGDEMLKAVGGMKNRPGLALQQTTDKAGHQTRRWRKTGAEPDKAKPDAKPDPDAYGAHNLKTGEVIDFKAGDFAGKGKIVGKPGKDGAHVRDASGRAHQVLWSEITGKAEAAEKGAAGASAPETDGGGQADSQEAAPAPGEAFFPAAEVANLPERVNQPVKSWRELVDLGDEGMTQFKTALEGVASTLGLRTDVSSGDIESHVDSDEGILLIGKPKSEARAAEKVRADYDNDWSQLRDYARATISVASVEDLHAAVNAAKAGGLVPVQVPKDRFSKPTREGYRDLLTIVKLPNGMLAELQFHLKGMTVAKKAAHRDYEVSRGLNAKYDEYEPSDRWTDEDHTAFYDAMRNQKDIYGAAWEAASGGKS